MRVRPLEFLLRITIIRYLVMAADEGPATVDDLVARTLEYSGLTNPSDVRAALMTPIGTYLGYPIQEERGFDKPEKDLE
ncbi:hypothetical protein SE17_00130 [Kouleothrix aurantiaca]|uniref:Uncharacterized protein n=1 Tax=Kouleothrix aurantiaca TaxID=186479 RepID=A0A0P9DYH6_9CHLR|nr:hypothetical protein SE17_00130 [Kouleothrix aurantiaca]